MTSEQYWCERCGGTIARDCRVEYDGKPYHRRCEYTMRGNDEYLAASTSACSPACKCFPQPTEELLAS